MTVKRPYLNVKGKRVTVMGLGRFGGGVAAVRFLAERGARVTVTDLLNENELAGSLAQLDGLRLAGVHLSGHRQRDFQNAELVVVNPAVPRHNRYLQLARRASVALTSEMNLFWQHHRGRVVGVTGSNGKSTTTALVHSILEAAGFRCWLGGNIGRSLLPVIDEIGSDDWVVLELSSFQLDDLNRLQASPDVAVVTNFSPNHLDWHGSLRQYRRAKQTILRWQTAEGTAVLNRDDPQVARWPANGRRLGFGTHDILFRDERGEQSLDLADWLPLPGRHNFQNALAATAAAFAAGADASAVRRGLQQFKPLPHRLQKVAEIAGRRFYNDSLATTPESVAVALDTFDSPVVLLAGGYDKQIDLTPLAESIACKTKAVALMGQTGEKLAALIAQREQNGPSPLRVCDSLHEAFAWAVDQSAAGDVVLLSPGCASYGSFRNFAERGERFTDLVSTLRIDSIARTD